MTSELRSDLSPAEWDEIEGGPLFNEDLAPVPSAKRNWGMWNIAALWVGMSVCIPTYMLASGLIAQGMNWWQAVLTVCLGNLIVVIPMILNAHAGTKFGITFPVFARASFGVGGAHVASMLRAVVACGWFGIQTWIGGHAIYKLALLLLPGLEQSAVIELLSNDYIRVNVAQFCCFLAFWALNVSLFMWKGMDSIKYVENWGAPLLLGLGLALLVWAYVKAGGFGPMFGEPSKFETAGQFWRTFFPALTGMVAFWATLSLNIPDFTRQARSQRDQALGQVLGLNTTMPIYAFIGVAVTSATVVIYGEAIWDPVDLLSRFESVLFMLIAMFALVLATLTTNMAANIVAPATSFSNLAPRRVSLRLGCLITGIIGIVMMPWKLVADPTGYIFTWLIGYSALLGPIGGILICDYFLIHKTELKLADLYKKQGAYTFHGGSNPAAMVALIVAILPNIPGFLGTIIQRFSVSPFWMNLYSYAWFTGFFIAFAVYYLIMKTTSPGERS
jgi:NCS1 family nucleobase:cation symporter-1